jgi:RHH-type rel operon transcriptional repressor/antitoxin RelB
MAISFELDIETEQRLKDLAKRTGKTPAFHLQELIAHGIEDLEDLYLAEATMQRIANGKEPVYSSAQVRKNLGLAD